MPRIFGVDIPKNKKIKISLCYIYGIGQVRALEILKVLKIDPERKADDLSDEEISQIASFVQTNYRIEGELRREIAQNIRRLIDVGSYRGSRHKKSLPVRGQRTKCNARTRKGPRPRVGGIKGR